MTFTEEDLSNTGKLKREVAQEAVKIASRENPTLYEYFEEVCEANGQRPQTVIGDMVVKAIDNDAFADAVLDEVVELGKLNKDQMRKEDAEMVQDLMEALGLDEKEDEDPVEKIIENRFEAATSGPMGMLDETQQQRQQKVQQPQNDPEKERLEQEVQELKRELNELKGSQVSGGVETDDESNKKDLDNLFDDEESSDVSSESSSEGEEISDEGSQGVDDIFGQPADDEEDSQNGSDESEDDFVSQDDVDVEEIPNDAWSEDDESASGPIRSDDAVEDKGENDEG